MLDAFRRSLSWARSVMGGLYPSGPGLFFRVSREKSRAAATATLFGVVLCATLAFTIAPRPKAFATAQATYSATTDSGPIKMVGGAPRSNVCDEQVWPYIEDRCRHVKIGSK
jgi:hypothetical protein